VLGLFLQPPRLLVDLLCKGLFLYLERDIGGILKKCYPHHPDSADEWLSDEIYRAACDPNALDVFKRCVHSCRHVATDGATSCDVLLFSWVPGLNLTT